MSQPAEIYCCARLEKERHLHAPGNAVLCCSVQAVVIQSKSVAVEEAAQLDTRCLLPQDPSQFLVPGNVTSLVIYAKKATRKCVYRTFSIAAAIPGHLVETPASTRRLVLVRRSEADALLDDDRLSEPTADLFIISDAAAVLVSSSQSASLKKSSQTRTGGSR